MNEHEQQNPSQPAAPIEAHPAIEQVRTVFLDEPGTEQAQPPGETNVSSVREGIRRFGESFLAYLILDGVEQRASDLVEQYEARYLGSFPDRHSFSEWATTDLGWEAELTELRHLQGMWLDDVTWDFDALWPELAVRYAVTERLGGVHVFRR